MLIHYGTYPLWRSTSMWHLQELSWDVFYAPTKFHGVGLSNINITMGLLQLDTITHEGLKLHLVLPED